MSTKDGNHTNLACFSDFVKCWVFYPFFWLKFIGFNPPVSLNAHLSVCLAFKSWTYTSEAWLNCSKRSETVVGISPTPSIKRLPMAVR